jgi:hypothetical protein
MFRRLARPLLAVSCLALFAIAAPLGFQSDPVRPAAARESGQRNLADSSTVS